MPWLLRALTRAGDGGAYEPASKYGPSSIKGSGNSWSSALGEPISDRSSYGLEISVCVTPDSSESDMTESENSK
ncbi:hypothetical protein Tco_1172696 [Tanacetum coccineum]